MNVVDVVLLVVLTGCALRGWWRGFFRECCGLLALIVGVAAALRFTAGGEAALEPHVRLPAPVGVGVAFVGIFVVVHGLINVVGALLDRLMHTTVLGAINAVGGAAFGVAKGAVVLAFLLLFLHLFPIISALDPQVMGSSIGRPLVAVASNAIRIGTHTEAANRT
ncbi:MAG TPA: CvpA family protein [Candidatus Margulisiibacteriota bacterium]|nr:CvpA family protein [Candidatus Margulisiibacteriota bacterium]